MVWQVLASDSTFVADRDEISEISLKSWIFELLSRRVGTSLSSDFYTVSGGRVLEDDASIFEFGESAIFRIEYRLHGGKGGFGSLLRAIGSQIERTTNREACRDLSGRRLRDVHNERRLKEWLAKQRAKRNTRKLEVLKSKLERMRSQKEGGNAKHMLHDSAYIDQCNRILDSIDQAMNDAVNVDEKELNASTSKKSEKPGTSVKRKSSSKHKKDDAKAAKNSNGGSKPKRALIANESGWLLGSTDINLDDVEADDEVGSDAENSSNYSSESGSEWSTASDELNEVAENQNPLVAEHADSEAKIQPTDATSQSHNEDLQKTQEAQLQPQNDESSAELRPAKTSEASAEHGEKEAQVQPDSNESRTVVEKVPVNFDAIELDQVQSEAQLCALGEAHLKHELTRRGLKCGGTLQERAARLFAVKGLRDDQIPAKLRVRPTRN